MNNILRLQESVNIVTRRCNQCRFYCDILLSKSGLCGAVWNTRDGLINNNYGIVPAFGVVQIDNGAILHYKPDSHVLSLGSIECNFNCRFCIAIVRRDRDCIYMDPENVIECAISNQVDGLCFMINEPTIWLDYIYDVAILARAAGLYVSIHSNGYISPAGIDLIAPVTDAICISFKGMGNQEAYNDWLAIPGVDVSLIYDSVERFYKSGVHTEVVGLLLRGYNNHFFTRELARNIVSISPDIPLKIDMMFPFRIEWDDNDMFSELETDPLADIARDSGLKYVYNRATMNKETENTYCPGCGCLVVKRVVCAYESSLPGGMYGDIHQGYYKSELNLINGRCPECNYKIYGVW